MRDKLLSVLKLALAILLLPLVIGVTAAFLESIKSMEGGVPAAFGWGIISYLILHILLYEPAQVYDTGKKISEKALGFFSPLVKVAGFCVPIFTILAFAAYFFASLAWKRTDLFAYFVFFASFAFAMHLVMTANSLKGKQPGPLKENYFFSLFFVYIVNMLLIAAVFDFLNPGFSYSSFLKKTGEAASVLYTASFKQLFAVEGRK